MLFASYACSTVEKPQSEEKTIKVDKTTNQSLKKILFFGNSLTAAYGIEIDKGYTSLIQEKIDSLNLKYEAINAGNSGETSSGGLGRISWLLKEPIDIFVLELGANDGLRGISTDETYKNLSTIIDTVKGKYPECKVILAGMQVPPNMGDEYSKRFKEIYLKLSKEKNVHLIPFMLENVAGIPELNLEDGIHPNEEGQKILAENVWKVLSPLL